MQLTDLIDGLSAHTIHLSASAASETILHVVASDLMSDVLVVDVDDLLLISSLASEQIVRTAHLTCAAAVLLVNDKRLPAPAAALAQQLDVTVLSTSMDKYHSCIAVHQLLERT